MEDGGWGGVGWGLDRGKVQLFRAKNETLSLIPLPKRDRLNDNTTHTLPLSTPLTTPPTPPTPPIHHYSHRFKHELLGRHNFLSFAKHCPCVYSRSRPRDRRLYNSTVLPTPCARKEWIPGPTPLIQPSLALYHSQPFAIHAMLLSRLLHTPYKHPCAPRAISTTTLSSNAETSMRIRGKNRASLHPNRPSILEPMSGLRREMHWLRLRRIGRECRRIGGLQTEG